MSVADSNIKQALSLAISLHKRGELQQAEAKYQAILNADPQHGDANYLMGLLAKQLGQLPKAKIYFEQAVKFAPDRVDYVYNLGQLHATQGDPTLALQYLEQTLALSPELEGAVFFKGVAFQRLGKIQEAISLFDAVITNNKEHAPSLFQLGILLRSIGQKEQSVTRLQEAVNLDTQNAIYRYQLGVSLFYIQNVSAARDCFTAAIELNPNFAEAYSDLGNMQLQLGELEEAVKHFEKAAEISPQSAELRNNLGNGLFQLRDLEGAKTQFAKAVELNKDHAKARSNLSIVLRALKQNAEAVDVAKSAVALMPNSAEFRNSLGNALQDCGLLRDAKEQFEQALKLSPKYADAHSNLGNVLSGLQEYEAAIEAGRTSVKLAPNISRVHSNLAATLHEVGEIEDAKAHLHEALKLKPDNINAHSNLASLYKDLGEFGKAQEHFEEALKLDPDFLMAYSNMLFAMNYDPSKSGEDIFEWYKKFNSHFASPLKAEWSPHDNETDPDRKLRIGYVAPSFCKHSTSYHLPPVFEHANKDEFEVYAYADMRVNDQFTAQYQAHSDHWIKTNGMSDEALAERIRADKIDILIDIAGHTKGNRLLTFARRPAPVALHWLDFGYTTGMDAIDYYLGDENVTPARDDHLFGEREVWRLDGPSVVYRPGPDMGEVSSLPAKENGFVTFCTLSRTVRLNEKTVKVWAEILKRVEGSKLRLDSRNYQDEMMCDLVAKRFAQFGIERDRLIMGFNSPPWDTLREIDIALDCFPHNSGTTLFEHLYMGNPYVTLYNRASVGTLGGAILRHSGFGEWVAQTEEEYVEIAVNLASDLDKLAETRASMRAKMQNSPAMDEKAFVKRMENAYRQMWKQYCEAQA